MDDGEVVTGWTSGGIIDLTVSGAGGLDGGTANANNWYEVYAIRKRSDGTKNYLLHRALDRNADQNTASAAAFPQNITVQVNRVTAPNVNVAQSFTANVTGPLNSIELRAFKTGTPLGNCWVTIQANSAPNPSGTQLAVSRKYDVSRAQTTHQAMKFVFDANTTVTAGTNYYWTFETDYTASDTNFMTLEGSSTNYFVGSVKGWSGAAWVNLQPGVGTLTFREYVEANNIAVTMPTGYDQRCLIGYVATDPNTKIKEFRQRDRQIMTPTSMQWMGYATLQISLPEVADFSGTVTVPPVQCDVQLTAQQGSGGINYAFIGYLDAIDLPSNGSAFPESRGFILGGAGCQGAIAYAPFPDFWMEHQACMVHVGVAVTKFYVSRITF
jgi:hypothetical protein